MDGVFLADEALDFVLKKYQFQTVLDIGSGEGLHARVFREALKSVVTIDSSGHWGDADIHGEFCDYDFCEPFDMIWCSHVLEHQLNVQLFLKKIYRVLKTGGVLAITVPPAKPNIVGGHVSIWNAGLVIYNLILAGFDCRDAVIKRYGYNISVIVRKACAVLPRLRMDAGDIEALSCYFPVEIGPAQNFNGDIPELNWSPNPDLRPIPGKVWGGHSLTIDAFRALPECHADDRENLLWSLRCAALPGDVTEFGVFQGGSLRAMSENQPYRRFHGFDSFRGLPEPWIRSSSSTYETGHFSTGRLPRFDGGNVRVHPGFFDESLPVWLSSHAEPLALIHIDADLYSSAIYVLKSLDHLIIPGTVVVFDELCDWRDSAVYPNWEEGEWAALKEWMQVCGRTVRLLSRGADFSASLVVAS
ncbi:Methyltransferase domain protein [Pseudomonas sp. 8AS]|uniref:class I SAM-dependent methyltransferase n=1 Tax=Pseudomonas sp. 8AS TaxID=2653163 RepID=UPI0012F1A31C|nr:class I SAM-dependent methyltransferase [Pseudomonas sp. 8AS]VXB91438.1 Methyltransferase domain protein [Pseudomonas sp. 8AS]